MTEPLPEYKRNALEQQHSALLEEYTAANRQLNATLSAVDRTKIERQIANLEVQIQKIEEQLGRGKTQTDQSAEPSVVVAITPTPTIPPAAPTVGTTPPGESQTTLRREPLGWFSRLPDTGKAAVIAGIFTVVVALIGLLGDVIPLQNGPRPTPPAMTYVVRVMGQNSTGAARLADARVTLEVPGRPPLDAFTDSNGVATIVVPAQYVGGPAVLVVEAAGFAPFRQNITVDREVLPPLVQLMPAQQP